jgi:sec-independent protein translocase protein TatA
MNRFHTRRTAMVAMLGPEDLGIVLVIGMVIFGSSKIPQLARSLGQAKNEFTKGLNESPAEDPPKAEDGAESLTSGEQP